MTYLAQLHTIGEIHREAGIGRGECADQNHEGDQKRFVHGRLRRPLLAYSFCSSRQGILSGRSCPADGISIGKGHASTGGKLQRVELYRKLGVRFRYSFKATEHPGRCADNNRYRE